MKSRQQFVKTQKEIKAFFDQAFNVGKELKQHYGKVLDIDECLETLTTRKKNWDAQRFEIVVVGEFSTGKSTFINALLQREILPSKVTPTTATVNFIRHLDELPQHNGDPIAKVFYKEGKEIEVPYDQLSEYVTEMSKSQNVSDNITHVDLYVDSPYLENGVVIVDTPGLRALKEQHEKITKAQIKKSNASILLFNMEQPGKLSEIKFLRDLSESIDRIFFVANRLDGVPKNEVQEVKLMLESALRENDYQKISSDRAIVYPVSALQALKARDEKVETKYWHDYTSDQLLAESQFTAFEERLETYLFKGEQAFDAFAEPFNAIEFFYEKLIQEISSYKEAVLQKVDMDDIEKQHQLAVDEANLRNMQLKKEAVRLKNIFNDAVLENEKMFNEKLDHLITTTKSAIDQVVSTEELEEAVQEELQLFNSSYQQLFDNSLQDLAENINNTMRNELNDFELKLSSSNNSSKVELVYNSTAKNRKSYEEIYAEVEGQFQEQEQGLKEEREQLLKKLELEAQLLYKRQEKEMKEREYQEDLRFQDMLIQSTPQTIKKHGVIKERRFWFNKEGIVTEDNEKYGLLLEQKRKLAKEKSVEMAKKLAEEQNVSIELQKVSSQFTSQEDLRDSKRELREQKNMAIMQRLNEQIASSDRQLQQEKRKIIRQFDTVVNSTKREYRTFLKEMDALKIAEKKIEDYIQKQDDLLSAAMDRASKLAEQKANSEQESEQISQKVEQLKERVNIELASLKEKKEKLEMDIKEEELLNLINNI